MEIYQMIYKKLEVFNNYKITNIILYKMLTIYSRPVYTNGCEVWYTIYGQRERTPEARRSLTIYSKGSTYEYMNIWTYEHMNIWTYEHMNICSLVIIAMSKFGQSLP